MSKLGSKKAKRILKNNKIIYGWHEDKYRYDPYLIQMVKDLKPKELEIAKIKGNKFIIMNYDGMEDVLTVSSS